MILTSEFLSSIIEEVLKEQEQVTDKDLTGSGISASDYAKKEREDISKASSEAKGLDNRERAIIRKVLDVLKKYAQQGNLAGGGEKNLIMKAVGPLSKKLKSQKQDTESK